MSDRPNPDDLLKSIQSVESPRGKLKIFLGYAAGVGKTYAMLEAAQQRRKQGMDVVVGYVETHGRKETEAMLAGLEIIPRTQVKYRNIALTEMDIDAVIKRHPELILVDEFAHTNVHGSRHTKRYLDVEEILSAGINVYTTLNIQHLESLNNIVSQVTGVTVKETIPDRLLDEASEIEVIDLPPDELLTRLNEGKVYIPEQARRAIQLFFRKGNLTALREISLRRAAERVDDQMRDYMQTRAIPGPWPVTERLMVCVSSSSLSERLIRTTRRLADEINAEWFAVYVETAAKPNLSQKHQERIAKTLQLAEELGAHTRRLVGHSIPETLMQYAHKHNITKIVVGKPLGSRLQDLLHGSLVDQLIRSSGNIDIYVISSREEQKVSVLPNQWHPHRPLGRYLLALLLTAASTLLGMLVRGNLEPVNLVMFYLASVVFSAVYLGRGPSLLCAVTGVLAFDFFLIPPYLTLAVSDTQYLLTFVVLFVVSIVVSTLTARVQEQAQAAVQRETRTSALYTFGRDLTSAANLKQVAEITINRIAEVFGREVVIFLPENGRIIPYASTGSYVPDANELAVANWVYEHDQPAGLGTETLPAAPLHCLPLKTSRGLVGVFGIHPEETRHLLTLEQRQTLQTFTNQAALAMERATLADQAKQAEILQVTEKLQSALLNSISHDLRTPLVSITGALSSLRENSSPLDAVNRSNLVETAYEEAERLNRLVGNLLNMTRLEAGAIHLNLEPCDIQDVIGAAMEQLEEQLGNRTVKFKIPKNLPLVPMDFSLMVQVLVNVLDNALKYSPDESPIEVSAGQSENSVYIDISDQGIGIPLDELERVFDKFYRVQRPENISGTGLGLAICRGIVETHGGRIQALNRRGGGTKIMIYMPKEKPA